jgi:hypothetical protein
MLRACPFCRTLYRAEEGKVCTECGIELVPMQALGPSADAALEEPEAPVLPEDQPLPWDFWERGRALLLGLSALGLGLFFTPWVEITLPESAVRSGFDLARGRAGWLWGGAVAYFVLLPLVWTRRTIARMRGVRVVVTLLASMTLVEVVMLLAFPPRRHTLVPFSMEWRWGIYASGIVSLATALVGLRFGGALPPLPPPPVKSIRPDGETLH